MPESTPADRQPNELPGEPPDSRYEMRAPSPRCDNEQHRRCLRDLDARLPGIEMLGEAVKVLAKLPGENAHFYRNVVVGPVAPM